ncbi:DUF5997 family protein [Gordonia sp. HY285]|uniref:DUF5997 family protein n=1 Tax=Gordonia liuliyuniae TaxID=2911517 RepID=A0ABS9ITG4_9ACTN|nr:DUF5997 family protein [Gordonia liuliyuniae]MCF8588832.1 DUF5997 family protein [Gordonia liuliyuniae]MCF8609288.1 DUF5997 family protein [Gordonia liuliyuniae]
MKPATAAKKLDVYLPATPAEFRDGTISRTELAALQTDPPQWLRDLRANGPHPKNLVAGKLGISNSGLVRGEITEALTTEQINALLAEMPDWLAAEREQHVEVLREERRVRSLHADRRRAKEQAEAETAGE